MWSDAAREASAEARRRNGKPLQHNLARANAHAVHRAIRLATKMATAQQWHNTSHLLHNLNELSSRQMQKHLSPMTTGQGAMHMTPSGIPSRHLIGA
jgi:hypothetical protein